VSAGGRVVVCGDVVGEGVGGKGVGIRRGEVGEREGDGRIKGGGGGGREGWGGGRGGGGGGGGREGGRERKKEQRREQRKEGGNTKTKLSNCCQYFDYCGSHY